ncbi:hypothetical protein ACFQO4_18260 [Saliphagus sp. GCM10025334]
MSEHNKSATADVDGIAVKPANARTSQIDVLNVPDDIADITRALAGRSPPTNPIVVLKAARWWYLHGRGVDDPVFQWALDWTRHLATDIPGDMQHYDAFLEYLVTVGFASDRETLRDGRND